MDLPDIPPPLNERELAWLLCFFWNMDWAYSSLSEAAAHKSEGARPPDGLLRDLRGTYQAGGAQGLTLTQEQLGALEELGL